MIEKILAGIRNANKYLQKDNLINRAIIFLLIWTLILLSYFPNLFYTAGYIKYELRNKEQLNINMVAINPTIKAISADSSNKLIFRVEVRDNSGKPVPFARIALSAQSKAEQNTIANYGFFNKPEIRTDKSGQALIEYTPPSLIPNTEEGENTIVVLKANLSKTNKFSASEIELVTTPIIFVHGYQENGTIFENLKEYLSANGFPGVILNYKSEEGIQAGAVKLSSTLNEIKGDYLLKGVQVNKFNIIAHSMGGLVARYYTADNSYIYNNNVGKIIFIAVPQKGSPLAALGASYFQDTGIRDLAPDSQILASTLPSMINKGLNDSIQIGSIVGEFDEVVSLESASLREWGINTYMFSIGKNRFTVDNFLNGGIIEAWNHKAILSNRKVFEKIYEMLKGDLPFPKRISP